MTSEEWVYSDSTSGFTQIEPQNGKPASEKTIVYVLQNEDYLFIAFKCYQNYNTDKVANITTRDQVDDSEDLVLLMLDTFDDKRSGL